MMTWFILSGLPPSSCPGKDKPDSFHCDTSPAISLVITLKMRKEKNKAKEKN
jgi:hypothetical protein